MKKLLSLIVLAFAIISCSNSEDPKYVVNTGFTCYNSVSDESDNTKALTAGNYDLKIDFTNLLFDMRMNVSLRNDLSPAMFSIKNIELSFDENGGYKFKVPGEVFLESGNDRKLTDLEGKIFAYYTEVQGYLQENYIFEISYKVDGRYKVSVVGKDANFYGTTITTPANGKSFNSDATVTLKLTDSKTATMTIRNAKFAEGMPAMTMEVKNLPFVPSEGGYTISTSNAIPEIGDKPYEQFAFTDIDIKVSKNGTELSSAYKCNFKGVMHTISTSASIFPKPKQQN